MPRDRSTASSAFDLLNYTLLLAFATSALLPFVYIIGGSLTSAEEMLTKDFVLIPSHISFAGYRYVFANDTLIHSLGITMLVTIVGTTINLLFTSLTAYPLSKKDLDGRGVLLMLVTFTMLFSGGMIPTFLVVKMVGLLNTFWALVIPNAINAFYLVVMKNFFQQIPESLEEAAKMEGCNDLRILALVVLPLSLPMLASFTLFYAVGHWNAFFHAVLYIDNNRMWPVQVWLRQIVILSFGGIGDSTFFDSTYVVPPSQIIKMTVIVVATLPILCVYPFLQKHFVKGALVGSVKG
jgi:putative aldouronate transport system permease protein